MKKNTGRGELREYIDFVTEKFNTFYHKNKKSTDSYIKQVKESGDFNNLETRIAWDMARACKYYDWNLPGNGDKMTTLFVQALRKSDIELNPKIQKPTTMTRKRTTAKAHGSSTTMRDASRILKAQKDDYQKIFRAEVKKSKDPKAGAKKAGKIYRDRYGATATARWKKALKRAK